MSNEFKDGEEERLLSEREKILADEEVKRSLLGPGRAQYAKKPKREFDFEAWRSWVASRYREPFDPEKEWRTFWFRDVAREGSVAAPSYTWVCDLYAFPNWSLASHYFNTGIALNLLATPVSFYLVETLNASSAVTNTCSQGHARVLHCIFNL